MVRECMCVCLLDDKIWMLRSYITYSALSALIAIVFLAL